MEQPRRQKLIQGLLALALACAVAAVCVLESRSPLAQALGAGSPWSAWLFLSGDSQEMTYLAVYQPRQRLLNLVYVPKTTKPFAGFPADRPRFAARHPEITGQEEPAQLAKDWLLSLRRLPEGTWQGISRFERLLLALELARLKAGSIRPAWLSEDPQTRDWHMDLLLGESSVSGREGRLLTAEVLNGSGRVGLASQGKKILRLRGVDVVTTGNLESLQARTIVYDRTGRYEDAAAVRQMLGCPSAAVVTRIDPKKLVDVSVTLADDCPLQ